MLSFGPGMGAYVRKGSKPMKVMRVPALAGAGDIITWAWPPE